MLTIVCTVRTCYNTAYTNIDNQTPLDVLIYKTAGKDLNFYTYI